MDQPTNILLGDLLEEGTLNEWQPEELWAFVHLIRKAQTDPTSCIGRLLRADYAEGQDYLYTWHSNDVELSLAARQSPSEWLLVKSRIFSALKRVQLDRDGGPPRLRGGKPASKTSNGGQAAGSAVQASGSAPAPAESRRSAAARKAALARWSRGNASDANACESHPTHDALASKPHSAHENRISAHANRIESHDAQSAKSAPERTNAPALLRSTPEISLSSSSALSPERTWNAEKPHSNAQNAVLMRSHATHDATDAESAGRGKLVGGLSAGARAQSAPQPSPTKRQPPEPSPSGPDEYEVNWNEQILSSVRWPWWEPQQIPAVRIRSLACGQYSSPARIAFILDRIEAMRQENQRKGKQMPNPMGLLISGLGLSTSDPNAWPWHWQGDWFEQWARDPRVAHHLRLHGEWKRLVAARAKHEHAKQLENVSRAVV